MAKISRRFILKSGLAAMIVAITGLLFTRPRWLHIPAKQLSADDKAILTSYLDIIIPSDTTPGALDLDVHKDILKQTEQSNGARRLVKQGCAWLTKKSRKMAASGFLNLDEKHKFDLVRICAEAAPDSLESRFFSYVRNTGFEFYYAKPQIWYSLNYSGPPQPKGFTDFHKPPGHNLNS